jgi:VWFA-related protein
MRRAVAVAVAVAVAIGLTGWAGPGSGLARAQTPAAAQTPAPPEAQAAYDKAAAKQTGDSTFTLSVDANIVLTNVVVRDKKTGDVVKGLTAKDFTITEDKTRQKIVSFDFENVDEVATLQEKTTTTGKASIADLLERNFAASPGELKDHRLMVLFFDLSSMQDEDIDRAVDAATKYVNTQMAPADLVALVSMSTGLSMDQDFTANKQALLRGLAKYNGDDETGFANGGTGSTDGTSDDTSAFAADDTEYNSLNTDRELLAIQAIAKSLERVDQRKSLLYFSGGLTRNGIENQASLRAATNEAAKANMAIYSVDSRGLQALPPVGDASKGSLRGNSAYSGSAVTAQFSANFGSQETLSTLSADTGGKAFFDSNDFGPAFQQVQHDTSAYYILGFHSTNQARDGSQRRLTVKVDRSDVSLEYRPSYYAPADFKHQKTEDRELALTEQMRSGVPATDVPVYLQALYFRQSDLKMKGPDAPKDAQQFYIPISLVVPGSQIPFVKAGDSARGTEKDKASIDILGRVQNAQGITVGNVRDTVKLALDQSQQVQRRNIQYSTGFTLAPGKYHLKFVVRENQTGNMGDFETDLQVPDLKKVALKVSSVVLASQRSPNNVKNSSNPLVRDGLEFVPNVAHVFRQDQQLYLLYEIYDPTIVKGVTLPAAAPGLTRREGGPIHVLTSIEFLSGGVKVYETPLVTADALNDPARNAVAFQFDVPLAKLKPGDYVCQVNVIDDAGGAFTFPRMALRITAAAAPAAAVKQ